MLSKRRKTIQPEVDKGSDDPISHEFIEQQLEDFALHLDDARSHAGKTPRARAYRIAVEHVQTALLWVKNANATE